MRRPAVLWALAILITLAAAAWQRMSGPTYPVRGTVNVGGETIRLRLARSHSIAARQPVAVKAANPEITGEVSWRRYPSRIPGRCPRSCVRGMTCAPSCRPSRCR